MDGVAGIDMETNRQGRVETIFTEYFFGLHKFCIENIFGLIFMNNRLMVN